MVKSLRLLFGALAAILCCGAALSTTALALPELLGQAANEEFKGKNTVASPIWENVAGERLECTAMTMSGQQTTDTTATVSLTLTGCKAKTGIGSFACNTPGDAKETELYSASVDYVWDAKPKTDTAGILVLLTEASLECTALVKLKLRGHLVCLVKTPLTLAKSHEFSCTGEKGKQSETTFFNDEEKEVKNQFLELSKNGGAFEQSDIVLTANFEFAKEVSFMNE